MNHNEKVGSKFVEIANELQWKPDIIYQIGVGRGDIEIRPMQKAWPNLKFIGCEPHPLTFSRLEKTYPGKLYEIAVGNKLGTTTLYNRPTHKNGASLYQKPDGPGKNEYLCKEKVYITTLDGWFKKPVAMKVLLWMDCEGSELDVLKGGTEFLKGVDVVNLEMSQNPPAEGWCNSEDVHDCLIKNRFILHKKHSFRENNEQYDAVYIKVD